MIAALLATQVLTMQPATDLDALSRSAFLATQSLLPNEKLASGDVAITVFQVSRRTGDWTHGSFNGSTPIYPASVVKLFWLAYLAHQLDTKKVKMTPEIQRAAEDMIKVSNNDATGSIVDLTTGALPGPELSGKAYQRYVEQKMAPNRWFESLGFTGLNVLNRTYNEGPYGREKQLITEKGRNALTTDGTARLMAEIILGKLVPSQGEWMRGLLRREIPADSPQADDQSIGFLGEVMPAGTQHWSKAGWTSQVRHDVSYDVMPDGREFVFCIFTLRPNSPAVLQTIARELLKGLRYTPNPAKTK